MEGWEYESREKTEGIGRNEDGDEVTKEGTDEKR